MNNQAPNLRSKSQHDHPMENKPFLHRIPRPPHPHGFCMLLFGLITFASTLALVVLSGILMTKTHTVPLMKEEVNGFHLDLDIDISTDLANTVIAGGTEIEKLRENYKFRCSFSTKGLEYFVPGQESVKKKDWSQLQDWGVDPDPTKVGNSFNLPALFADYDAYGEMIDTTALNQLLAAKFKPFTQCRDSWSKTYSKYKLAVHGNRIRFAAAFIFLITCCVAFVNVVTKPGWFYFFWGVTFILYLVSHIIVGATYGWMRGGAVCEGMETPASAGWSAQTPGVVIALVVVIHHIYWPMLYYFYVRDHPNTVEALWAGDLHVTEARYGDGTNIWSKQRNDFLDVTNIIRNMVNEKSGLYLEKPFDYFAKYKSELPPSSSGGPNWGSGNLVLSVRYRRKGSSQYDSSTSGDVWEETLAESMGRDVSLCIRDVTQTPQSSMQVLDPYVEVAPLVIHEARIGNALNLWNDQNMSGYKVVTDAVDQERNQSGAGNDLHLNPDNPQDENFFTEKFWSDGPKQELFHHRLSVRYSWGQDGTMYQKTSAMRGRATLRICPGVPDGDIVEESLVRRRAGASQQAQAFQIGQAHVLATAAPTKATVAVPSSKPAAVPSSSTVNPAPTASIPYGPPPEMEIPCGRPTSSSTGSGVYVPSSPLLARANASAADPPECSFYREDLDKILLDSEYGQKRSIFLSYFEDCMPPRCLSCSRFIGQHPSNSSSTSGTFGASTNGQNVSSSSASSSAAKNPLDTVSDGTGIPVEQGNTYYV